MIRRMSKIGQAAYGEENLFVDVAYRRPVCGCSVADRSYFHPDSAVVRNASLGVPPVQQYTFQDGKDDGRAMPPYSRPDCDIVELTEYAKKQSDIAKDGLEKAKLRAEYKKSLDEYKKAHVEPSQGSTDNFVKQPNTTSAV